MNRRKGSQREKRSFPLCSIPMWEHERFAQVVNVLNTALQVLLLLKRLIQRFFCSNKQLSKNSLRRISFYFYGIHVVPL